MRELRTFAISLLATRIEDDESFAADHAALLVREKTRHDAYRQAYARAKLIFPEEEWPDGFTIDIAEEVRP